MIDWIITVLGVLDNKFKDFMIWSLKSIFSEVLTGTLTNYRLAAHVRMIPLALT